MTHTTFTHRVGGDLCKIVNSTLLSGGILVEFENGEQGVYPVRKVILDMENYREKCNTEH